LLGVQVQDLNSQSPNTPSQIAPVNSGAVVIGVQGNTGATDAGLKEGDVITSVDGKAIADSSALHLALTVYHPGDSVKVVWVDANGATLVASDKDLEKAAAGVATAEMGVEALSVWIRQRVRM
jgi:S1-C subfamily serine protease